jgi:hypothetical protein
MTTATTAELAIDPAVRAYVDERLAELRARGVATFLGDAARSRVSLFV